MSAGPGRYAPPDEAEVTGLIREYPLAWVVTSHDGDFGATLLPLRPFHDAEGRLTELHGHFARSNSQVELVRRNPRALMLFLGPHGYISPSWLTDRTMAPTWNYASAQFVVDIEFIEDGPRMETLMRDLAVSVEAGRERAWSIEDMGTRYQRLIRGVIGFHARIREARVKFKLGQDERDDNYAEIMKALSGSESAELREWMARCNPGR
jgi:transcriptional regulator